MRASAQATADSTEDAGDSWEDYADRGLKSLDQFSATLEEQNTAHQQWRDNLIQIAQQVGPDVAGYLAEMGEDGVMLTAQFADGTAEETARAAAAIRQNMSQGTAEATTALDQGLQVMAAVARGGGKATAAGIAAELKIGVEEVARIAAQYGVRLAAGIDPLLIALGKRPVGRMSINPTGGLQESFADGGFSEQHIAQIAQPGVIPRVWAEAETGGETYLPPIVLGKKKVAA